MQIACHMAGEEEAMRVMSLKPPAASIVGSVKGDIAQAADNLGLSRQFIGGHPMGEGAWQWNPQSSQNR